MVGRRAPAGALQPGGFFFGNFAGGCVDDGGARLLVWGAERFGQQSVDALAAFGRAMGGLLGGGLGRGNGDKRFE